MFALISGLAAGAAHVVTGPDHLAALAPIAVDRPVKALGIGLRWGFGHGLGVVLLGGLGIVAHNLIDVEAISAWSEFIVGFMLVAMGLWALRSASRMVIHTHGHTHEGDDHAHLHVHASEDSHDSAAHRGHSHAAFFVGLLHGAAGTGHLLGVLPSLALQPVDAAIYLAAYFVAAIAAMGIFGGLMGHLARRFGLIGLRRLMYGVSSVAIGVGALWLVRFGV